MRFSLSLCSIFLAHAEEDATYLLQSQVLRASVSDHQNASWSSCGGSVDGDNNAGRAISGGGPAPGISDSCACKSACDARSDCAGWTFTANNRGFTYDGCVLRGNWGSVVRNCNGFCTSAKKAISTCGGAEGENNAGRAISGGGPAPGITDSCSCKSACDARSDCAGWTFTANNRGFTYDGCVLRGNWGAVVRNCNGFCASAKKAIDTCGGAEGENNAGSTISGGNPAAGIADSCSCRSACDARSDCVGWTFTSGCPGFTSNGCFLRGQWGGVVRNCGSGFCASAKKEVKAACSGAQPRCAGVACINGQWMCAPPASCSGAQPKCAGVGCIDGQWMCSGDYCPGTDSPGGETDVTDVQCFDADRGFGPGFSCANTEMYCSSDSGDGLTVGACCQTRCRKEFENKKKNSNAENRGKSEAERKRKRAGNEGSRKKNEKERKKKRKDTEWNTKRDASETRNKNAEDERKSKRGWKEGQRKNERGWKQNKRQRQAAADQRERARKETRNKNNKKPAKKPISKKACANNKRKYAKCKANAKCEKKFKKKGRKEPTC